MLILLSCMGAGQFTKGLKRKLFGKSQNAFSLAEALIALAVVGCIMGVTAPLISRQLNDSQMSGLQMQQVNKRIERIEKSLPKKSTEVLNPTIISRLTTLNTTLDNINTTLTNKITAAINRIAHLEAFVGSSYAKPITGYQSLHARVLALEGKPDDSTDDYARNLISNLTQRISALENNSNTNDGVPIGVILMWSGSVNNIPAGWTLCNGLNGTPDLRDRFVVGAGSGYPVGATGGANTVTLQESQIPPHRHLVHGYAGPVHADKTNHQAHINAGTNGGSSSYTGSIGGGQPHENRPPYYALAYIMKIRN